MDFCSDYVYLYETLDYEYISDEEYEAGMNISNSESEDSDEEVTEDAVGRAHSPTEVTNENAMQRDSVPAPAPAPGLPTVAPPSGPSPLTSGGAPPPLPPIGCYARSDRVASSVPPRRKPKKMKQHWRSAGNARTNLDSTVPAPGKHRRVRQGDTNVVSVKFDKLISPSNMHAGDAQTCTQCGAILSSISKLTPQDDQKVWDCEFCDTRNILDIEDEEKPQESDVTFMLEPALSTSASGPTGLDESLVVFCVDVSGSMCVTTEVPGHVELRGAAGLRRAQLLNRDRSDQYLPRQRRNVTYVSRLQSVQAAIDHQLQEMAKDYPNRRVALVAFSNEVTVYGDGKVDPLSIAGDKLSSKDTLRTLAAEQPFPDAIKNTRQQLGNKLFELEECGPTALGPALLVASTMAAKVRGSKVILCTDGLANVGMGKLDNFKSDQEKEDSVTFYDEMSDMAAENGVSISVVTIKGTDCKLVEIGKMADKTGGQVNIVDPLKLTQEFSTILANKIIATNVVATFILHKELFFFYEHSEESKVVKSIGNVTVDSEISFEYGVRTKPKDEKKVIPDTVMEVDETTSDSNQGDKMETDQGQGQSGENSTSPGTSDPAEPSASGSGSGTTENTASENKGLEGATGSAAESSSSSDRKEIPFQLQIVYTDTEGAKALRVITQSKPVTTDRKKAEKLAKIDVLARHTAMNTARMAQDGMYTMCRERALMNQRVAWRHTRDTEDSESRVAYKKRFGKIKTMENYLNMRQQSERATTGHTYSDEECDVADEAPAPTMSPASSSKGGSSSKPKGKSRSFLSLLKKKRSETTDDAGAALVFKGKNAKQYFESDSD